MEEGLIEKDDNCIICLDECIEDDYFKFPISKSTCECKYNMHVKCYKQYKPECPMCKKEIKPLRISDFKGMSRYSNYNEYYDTEERLNKKLCFGKFILCAITLLIILGIFIYIFYFAVFENIDL